jgi:hypothetical protein
MNAALSWISVFALQGMDAMTETAIKVKAPAPKQTFWGGWDYILGFTLWAAMITLVAIMVVGLFQMFAKHVELEQPMKDVGPLRRDEMSFFEKLAQNRPLLPRIGSILALAALVAFFAATLGSMGNEDGFADKMKKEGAEKGRLERERLAAEKEGMTAGIVGDDSSDEGMKAGMGFDIPTGMDAMKPSEQ